MRHARWNDEDDDGEFGDAPDDDAGDVVEACPWCGEEMYDDSPRCPACGQYRSREDSPPDQKPAWVLMTAVVLLILMLVGLANFL